MFSQLGVYLPVTHKFLDANGEVTLNILEAKSLQFDFDIGDEIVQTLANIDLDLGIPLLSLKGQMEPTLTVDWNLHFGFGVDLDKGFYFVSKFDEEAGEPGELLDSRGELKSRPGQRSGLRG